MSTTVSSRVIVSSLVVGGLFLLVAPWMMYPVFLMKLLCFALLAGSQPAATLLSGFVLAALDVGANSMQIRAGVPIEVVKIIQGLVILFVVGREYFDRRMMARRRSVAERLEHEAKNATGPERPDALTTGPSI